VADPKPAPKPAPKAQDADTSAAPQNKPATSPIASGRETEEIKPNPPKKEKVAPPAPVNEARAAFREGDRRYLEGDYAGAIISFESAYALSGRIEMLFNLANAHEQLDNYDKASVALRGYIPHSPEAQRPALERRLERLEKLVELQRKTVLNTERTVKELKENPRPFPVDRTLGIGLLTLGSAGLITGTVFAITAGNARTKLDRQCESGANGRLCPSEADTLLRRDKSQSIAADVSLLAGASLAAVGVYLVVRSAKKDKHGEIAAGLGPQSIFVRGAF
jgi:tetratricopeptide (TPR) repeat protein